jgi:short-subunit dehydrogenase
MKDQYACYTMITGASLGLGRSLALECASRGMNLVLVALPDEGLDQLRSRINALYSVDVQIFEGDLERESSLENLVNQLAGIPINILINNAGKGGTYAIDHVPIQYVESLIALNILAPVYLTCRLIPELSKHSNSNILNVSSLMSQYPSPYKTVYPASKAFLFSFTRGLNEELRDTSITASVLLPGVMRTNHSVAARLQRQSFLGRNTCLEINKVAKITVDQMLKGRRVIVPGFFNKIIWLLMKVVPFTIGMPIMNRIYRRELDHFEENESRQSLNSVGQT